MAKKQKEPKRNWHVHETNRVDDVENYVALGMTESQMKKCLIIMMHGLDVKNFKVSDIEVKPDGSLVAKHHAPHIGVVTFTAKPVRKPRKNAFRSLRSLTEIRKLAF